MPAFHSLSPRQASALLTHARALQQAARAGATQPLLKGKRLGLVCKAIDEPDAALFRDAAEELGAHVTHVPPSLSEASTPLEVAHTARLLGRLYDAVECQGMPPALVRRMGDDAGVPVYDGIASRNHPTARLVEQLDADASAADNRRILLQALLLSTLA
jgi:ornithine carbamoyltransferase